MLATGKNAAHESEQHAANPNLASVESTQPYKRCPSDSRLQQPDLSLASVIKPACIERVGQQSVDPAIQPSCR